MSKTVPLQPIQFSISTQFKCKYTIYLSKTFLLQATQFSQRVLIQTIQFSISMQFNSIKPIDRALSGATILGQSGPESNGNEGVLHISQSSSITGTSPSNCLVSYPGLSLGWGSYPSADVQSVYSTAAADWANLYVRKNHEISKNCFHWFKFSPKRSNTISAKRKKL